MTGGGRDSVERRRCATGSTVVPLDSRY